LRFYETTIVLSPQSDDAAIGHEIDKITQTIAADAGRLVSTQKWGVKRMAYPIQKHTQGHYIHFVYQAPPSVPGKLESAFRINESVLRHLTVLVDGPLLTGRAAEEAAAESAAQEGGEAERPAPSPEARTEEQTERASESETDEQKADSGAVAVAEKPDNEE